VAHRDLGRLYGEFFRNDSVSVAIQWRGDTIHSLTLSPAVEHRLDTALTLLGDALGRGLGRAMWILLAILAIYLVIPLSLTGLTIYWLGVRRHGPAAA
jgi:hypothetical protein